MITTLISDHIWGYYDRTCKWIKVINVKRRILTKRLRLVKPHFDSSWIFISHICFAWSSKLSAFMINKLNFEWEREEGSVNTEVSLHKEHPKEGVAALKGANQWIHALLNETACWLDSEPSQLWVELLQQRKPCPDACINSGVTTSICVGFRVYTQTVSIPGTLNLDFLSVVVPGFGGTARSWGTRRGRGNVWTRRQRPRPICSPAPPAWRSKPPLPSITVTVTAHFFLRLLQPWIYHQRDTCWSTDGPDE